MFRRLRDTALAVTAFAATAALHPGAAFACETAHRTIELAPGQNVGGFDPAFGAAALREKEVVLTFDDGPDSYLTPRVLDILRENCVPATFFVLGESARRNPSLVKRQLAEGHVVGGHTVSHGDLSLLPFNEATQDIAHGFLSVTSAGGEANLFRFPHLQSTPALLDWLGEHGMAAVAADIDPMDWAGDPPDQTLARLKEQLDTRRGGIILLHDNQPNTAELLPQLLAFLRREGYSVVGLRGAPAHRQLASGQSR